MARFLLRLVNGGISLLLTLCVLLAGSYAGYCLWDNNRIYAAAEGIQAELLSLKPRLSDGGGGDASPGFAELFQINPDVCAWITMDNTKIDYPVLQGESNMDYINTDVYGNFALAGSIFLDARNERDLSDPYSVLYGHHMENGSMFGDLDSYKDEAFFKEYQAGMLILTDGAYTLQVFACMLVKASEERVFQPDKWDMDSSGLMDYVETEALYVDRRTMEALRGYMEDGESVQVLALTTCSYEFTDARTVVLAVMNEYSQEGKEVVNQ